MRRFFGVVFAVALLIGCAGVETADIEPVAQAQWMGLEPRVLHVRAEGTDADRQLVQEAVATWVSACGPIIDVSDSGEVVLTVKSMAEWPHPGYLGMTSATHDGVGVVEILEDENRARMLVSAAHEIGHAMGAQHVDEHSDVMNAVAWLDKRMPVASDCPALWYAPGRGW